MRKALLAVAVAGTLAVTFGAQAQDTPDGYQLEQVLIMSRHNLRAPLANNGSAGAVHAEAVAGVGRPGWTAHHQRGRTGSVYGSLYTRVAGRAGDGEDG